MRGFIFVQFLVAMFICMAVVLIVGSTFFRFTGCVDRGKTYVYCIFDGDDDGQQLNDGW